VISLSDYSAQQIIEELNLQRLAVEGTYYKNTYVGELNEDQSPIATAMIGLYATSPLSNSIFHKLEHDEIWHHYAGSPIDLHLIHPDGRYEKVMLGASINNVQFVVPKNVWQAGEVSVTGDWGLFGCTMAPGFTGSAFTAASRSELLKLAPEQRNVIERLTLPESHDKSMPEGFKQ